MRYPVAIESGDARHAYGVIAPDLPGCFSAGDTLGAAVANAEEAILLYLVDVIDAGKAPPVPTALERLAGARNGAAGHGPWWTWTLPS